MHGFGEQLSDLRNKFSEHCCGTGELRRVDIFLGVSEIYDTCCTFDLVGIFGISTLEKSQKKALPNFLKQFGAKGYDPEISGASPEISGVCRALKAAGEISRCV